MSNLSENMTSFFDERAKGYDAHMQNSVSEFEKFYKAVAEPIKASDNVIEILDLGCGSGLELTYIFSKAPNANITGIDLSMKMLENLSNKFQEKIEQLQLIKGSYLDYPLGQNFYDYAVSVMSVHHFLPEEKTNLYRKIHNALTDNGIYIEGDYVVDSKDEKELLAEYHKKMKSLEKGQLYHIDIPFTMQRQIQLLRNAGFSKVDIVKEGLNQVVLAAKK